MRQSASGERSMNYGRVAQLYKYFPFKTATALMLCEATRALFTPYIRFSYGFCAEDLIVPNYLDLSRAGFYVDVGCNHPIWYSNTVSLYSRGWRGVVVDGNRELIELFRRTRPRDTPVCSVVSNREGPLTFTLAKNPAFSTVSPEFEREVIGGESGVVERVEVNAVTLQTIMEENKVPFGFDLLSIDVEGHDYQVLTSFDIDTFRPHVIVVEMQGFLPACGDADRIYRYLEKHQYQLRGYSVLTGIFVDSA
jgi:FkbM family methyltransferase